MTATKRLLKAHTVTAAGSQIAFNYEDLRQQCDEYIENINAQARQILADANAQAKIIREKAFEEGREAGQSAGLKESKNLIETRAAEISRANVSEQLRTTLPALKAAVEAIRVEKDRWLAWWEAAAVRLSAAIAEKIIRRELDRTPEIAPAMIAEALQLAAGSSQIRVRMHPRDVQQLSASRDVLTQQLSALSPADIVSDERITPGGCYIETTHGAIDSRLETQLCRITEELLEGNAIP